MPTASSRLGEAEQLAAGGQTEAALQVLGALVGADAAGPGDLAGVLGLYARLGRKDLGAAAAEAAMSRFPDDPALVLACVNAAMVSGILEAAVSAFGRLRVF